MPKEMKMTGKAESGGVIHLHYKLYDFEIAQKIRADGTKFAAKCGCSDAKKKVVLTVQ